MLSYLKYALLLIYIVFNFSCKEGKKLFSYSVADIASKSAREIEEMGSFNVNGIVDGKVNLGFIKAYKFCSQNDNANCIYILSNHKSLPSGNRESIIKIKLYKEIAFSEAELLIFEEVKD
jgi:hypothetical protein